MVATELIPIMLSQHTLTFQAVISITFARKFGSHVLINIVPCYLLQTVGFCVFLIPFENISDRLTVSVSSLIVMATLFTQVGDGCPAGLNLQRLLFTVFRQNFHLTRFVICVSFRRFVMHNPGVQIHKRFHVGVQKPICSRTFRVSSLFSKDS